MTEAPSVLSVRGVLLVSVPPDPEDAVISSLQEDVLRAMAGGGSRGLVLDISQVDVVDSYFARMIAETAQMVALMGGRTVIAGMRAPVAITAIQLGLQMRDIGTALDVDRALDRLQETDGRSGRDEPRG